MNCEAVKELLWAYLEKEATEEENSKIEAHLANCQACREELEAQKEIKKALSGLPDEELPEGYHTELMEKLQMEAAPNVVPFPGKMNQKKKTPRWKQLSMIAAAVLVVVAAGGINGMLEMRQSQNEAIQQLELATDTTAASEMAEPAEGMPADGGSIEKKEIVDAAAEYQMDTSNSRKMVSAEMGAAVAKDKNVEKTMETAETDAVMDMAAVPETVSVTAEEATGESALFSAKRSAEKEAADWVVLQVADEKAAMLQIQRFIAEAGGYEEGPYAGDDVTAIIPAENYDGFVEKLQTVGKLEWMKQGNEGRNAAEYSVGIRFH